MELSDDLSGIRDITDRCIMFMHMERKYEKLLAQDVKFLLEKRIVQTCYSHTCLVQFVPLFIPDLAKAPNELLKQYMRDLPAPVALAMFMFKPSLSDFHSTNGQKFYGTCGVCNVFSQKCELCNSCSVYFCSPKCKVYQQCIETATTDTKMSDIDFLVEDLLKIVPR